MFKKKYTNDELIEMIKGGGKEMEKAISYILTRNRAIVEKLIIALGGNKFDAEDELQDGIVALISAINRSVYNKKSEVHTYLVSICKYSWYKKHHKKVKERTYKENITINEEDLETPEVIIIQEELKEKLKELEAFLGKDCFQILHLSSLNYSSQEIADKMPAFGSPQTIMNKKYKCKKKLNKLMENSGAVKKFIKELRPFYYKDN